ncbi:hypothetical protein BHM03_00023174 [Ensete ventricosum]|nr:hypothetical protein BHM03_00023174 [Ensete ventricosum]
MNVQGEGSPSLFKSKRSGGEPCMYLIGGTPQGLGIKRPDIYSFILLSHPWPALPPNREPCMYLIGGTPQGLGIKRPDIYSFILLSHPWPALPPNPVQASTQSPIFMGELKSGPQQLPKGCFDDS